MFVIDKTNKERNSRFNVISLMMPDDDKTIEARL